MPVGIGKEFLDPVGINHTGQFIFPIMFDAFFFARRRGLHMTVFFSVREQNRVSDRGVESSCIHELFFFPFLVLVCFQSWRLRGS
jgi:hypothetical protein